MKICIELRGGGGGEGWEITKKFVPSLEAETRVRVTHPINRP
jgi:hypothetical protein